MMFAEVRSSRRLAVTLFLVALFWSSGAPSICSAQDNCGQWFPLASGTDGAIYALAADDGPEPVLYAGGSFSRAGDQRDCYNVAQWGEQSGSWEWGALGTGLDSTVRAFAFFDDGTGLALYAAGLFAFAGNVEVNHVARWNGQYWVTVGGGTNGPVYALAVFDDGRGPALYAGGTFSQAGEIYATSIARWDGQTWEDLAGGIGNYNVVYALSTFDDGTGPALYAGGVISDVGLIRWDGNSWVKMPVYDYVYTLEVGDHRGQSALYIAGNFWQAGGVSVNNIVVWDGTSWDNLAGGINGSVTSLASFNNGLGTALFAGGTFAVAGGTVANNIARWDGYSWTNLGDGMNNGVYALKRFRDGGLYPALHAGGNFTQAGGEPVNNAAKWSAANPACRAGNIDTGDGGDPADVLAISGDSGRGNTCREVFVRAGSEVDLNINAPPSKEKGHYGIWIYDGQPFLDDETEIHLVTGKGDLFNLGLGCRCLPVNNTEVAGSCLCPVTFPTGRTSRSFGSATAAMLCLNSRPGFAKYPTTFSQIFPAGVFTVCGVIQDDNAVNSPAKNISLANWIVVYSL